MIIAKCITNINKGRAMVKSESNFQIFDTSKDKDPSIEHLQTLYINNFDNFIPSQ